VPALIAAGQSGVFACSALKQKYRDQLRVKDQVHYVYLCGSDDLIWSRRQPRTDHDMKPNRLASQFDALEEPPDALTWNITLPPEQRLDAIVENMRGS